MSLMKFNPILAFSLNTIIPFLTHNVNFHMQNTIASQQNTSAAKTKQD